MSTHEGAVPSPARTCDDLDDQFRRFVCWSSGLAEGPVYGTPPRRAAPPAPAPSGAGRSPAPTPGQTAWLATLTDAQRRRLESLPVRDRRRLMAPHFDGVNPDAILAREAALILGPREEGCPAGDGNKQKFGTPGAREEGCPAGDEFDFL